MPTNKKSASTEQGVNPPKTFFSFIQKFPELGEALETVSKGVDAAGPLDHKTCELIKIGICVGARQETALRSHVRRALHAGADEREIEQAIVLAMNTCGFPTTVAAWKWAREEMGKQES